jgi:CO/xanthine dehydrogenase Mo-binding subunit
MVMSKMVGARVRRKEDPRLITGSSTYVDDVQIPGMLHAAIFRSPYAHGVIKGVDVSAAEAAPGVVAVITGDTLTRILKTTNTETQDETTGEGDDNDEIQVPPIHPLAIDKVRYVGEPVAVVVAATRAQAVDAAELVELDVDMLDVVTDVFAAMEDGAPQLYDQVANNIGATVGGTRGADIDAAFANAAFTTKARIRSQRLNAVPMETRAVAATIDPITRGLTVWTSTQAPHWNRNSNRQRAWDQPEHGPLHCARGRRRLRPENRLPTPRIT